MFVRKLFLNFYKKKLEEDRVVEFGLYKGY